MTARRNLARASAAVLATLVVLVLACGGTALAAEPTITIESPHSGISTSDQSPPFNGTTDDPLDPVTLDIYAGPSATGTPVQSPTLLMPTEIGPLEATWEIAPETPLAPGVYTAVAEQTEESETGRSTPVTFTIDTTPPAVTMSPVASPTKDATPTLSGAAGVEAGDDTTVSVTVYKGTSPSGTVAASDASVPVSGSTWSYTPPHLADGTYTAQATQEDEAGNVGKSAAVTFTIDTTPPAVTLHAPATPTKDPTPTLTGVAGTASGDIAAVTVTIYKGKGTTGTVQASGAATVNGAEWTYTAAHLPEGVYTAQATQEDKAGNVGKSAADSFTVDTTAPAVTMNAVKTPTNNPEPTLSGDVGQASGDHASVTVKIYDGPSAGGTVAQSASGTVTTAEWTYKATHLPDGTYTAQVEQSDEAGNVGKSAAVTFTVDTVAPAVTLNAVASPTKDATPTLSGAAGQASGDRATVTVKIYDGPSASGTVAQSASVTPNGAEWSYTATTLADGTYTAQAEQLDEAGNVGRSSAVTFTIDTTPPAVTLNAVPTPTNDATPTLSGAVGGAPGDIAAVTVTIYKGSAVGGTVAATGAATVTVSKWSYAAPHLGDGTYTAQAEQSDEAGNVGKSAAVTFTVDTKAPIVSINPVASPTNDATPTLSGSAGTLSGDDASVTVTIYEGSSTAGPMKASGSVAVSGSTWSYTPTKALAEGTYTAQATQEDKAGNLGKSAEVTFTVDTTPPAVSINPVAAFTKDTTPTLTGGAGTLPTDDQSVAVTIYEGSSTAGPVKVTGGAVITGSTWSFTPTKPLVQGTYTAQATQEDKAGNVGKSAAVTFTVDTTPPAVTINAVATPTKDTTPTFSGAAGVAVGDQSSVTVKIYKGEPSEEVIVQSSGVAVVDGAWSYTASILANGVYTVEVSQSDAAGNVTSLAVAFTVDTVAPVVSIEPLPTPSKDQTPTLTGHAGVAPGDHKTVTVNIYRGEAATGTPIESSSVTVSGETWSYKTATLADDTYTAQATQEDDAGNLGKSAAVTFTVDTTPPVVSINPVAAFTNDATPTFTGVAGALSGDDTTVGVTIYEGSSTSGPVKATGSVAVSGTTWSYTPAKALADGTYTVQATQEDKAGNVGKSAADTFTVDTVAPVVSVTSPAKKAKVPTPTPTFSGLAGVAAGDDPSVTVNVYSGNVATGTPLETLHVTPAGEHWTATSTTELKNGSYTVQAEQADDAGNVGKSAAVTFEVATVLSLEKSAFVQRGSELVTGPEPSFSGTSNTGDTPTVTVTVDRLTSGTPEEVQSVTISSAGPRWTTVPFRRLTDGSYVVQAEQEGEGTVEQEFTVDADPPQITLTSPVNGSTASGTDQLVSGAAGTADGDLPEVTVRLYAGATTTGTPLPPVTVGTSGSTWTATLAGLAPGTYTAEAEQSDDVGNVGHSAPVTFTLAAPPAPPSPPAASFRWVPSTPHPGEPVTLISTSTDPSSPITGFAWAPLGNEAFAPGESALTTSFSTAGAHLVQLRVTDANGLSSVAAETIAVAARAATLIQPFPVVHMAGSYDAAGVKISLLTVQAPIGATVTVKCRGTGCPTKSETMAVASGPKSKAGTIVVTLKRFERPLHAGVVLEIEVTDHEAIGKFTKFVIRHNKPPTRQDLCLNPAGTTPILCPS